MAPSSITHALISVSDKTGLVPLARRLARLGITILSTGGTAQALRDSGIAVTNVSDHTGFPEILDGRVKTLHPRIHGGILARGARDAPTLAEHAIPAIGLVIVNLYPFRETTAAPDCTLESGIEQIDIGGPAMLRAAAKNHANVLVVVDPADYEPVVAALEARAGIDTAMRQRLAVRAFEHTAAYDRAVAEWLGDQTGATGSGPAGQAGPGAEASIAEGALPEHFALTLSRRQTLRYGENPHQAAAVYDVSGALPGSEPLLQHSGKALSFNNIVDAETALGCVHELEGCACVIVKHANPCGAAIAEDPLIAYERALAADPVSAFGGIVAFNRPIDAATIQAVLDRQFVEVIVCPAVTDDPGRALSGKPNVRLLTSGEPSGSGASRDGGTTGQLELRPVRGGVLVQQADTLRIAPENLRVVTQRAPQPEELGAMRFAWTVVKWVKSNAIVYARDGATLGIGAGQTSRIDSARFGAERAGAAGFSLAGAAMASDAFFPFRDSIDAAAAHGVTLIIQPGGSKRDDEVIAAADEHDIAMVFTGHRHFRH